MKARTYILYAVGGLATYAVVAAIYNGGKGNAAQGGKPLPYPFPWSRQFTDMPTLTQRLTGK